MDTSATNPNRQIHSLDSLNALKKITRDTKPLSLTSLGSYNTASAPMDIRQSTPLGSRDTTDGSILLGLMDYRQAIRILEKLVPQNDPKETEELNYTEDTFFPMSFAPKSLLKKDLPVHTTANTSTSCNPPSALELFLSRIDQLLKKALEIEDGSLPVIKTKYLEAYLSLLMQEHSVTIERIKKVELLNALIERLTPYFSTSGSERLEDDDNQTQSTLRSFKFRITQSLNDLSLRLSSGPSNKSHKSTGLNIDKLGDSKAQDVFVEPVSFHDDNIEAFIKADQDESSAEETGIEESASDSISDDHSANSFNATDSIDEEFLFAFDD